MAKKRRQARIPTPEWHRAQGGIGDRILGRSFQFYGAVVIAVLVAVALGVITWAFVSDELEERGRPGSTAVRVDDTSFRLDYFANRLTMYVSQNGGNATDAQQRFNALSSVTELLIQEEIVHRFADEFGVTASDQEVRDGIANRLGIAPNDETFDVVLEQELARTGIDEELYRRMVEATVITDKIVASFQQDLPETAESAHYRQILVSTEDRAQELLREVEAGGDFAALAEENSLDPNTREDGGDIGWLPRGVLDSSAEELVFALEPGERTTIPTAQGVLLIEMLEKDPDREIAEEMEQPLAGREFDDWVQEKRQSLDIVNNMDVSDGDAEKIGWAIDGARA